MLFVAGFGHRLSAGLFMLLLLDIELPDIAAPDMALPDMAPPDIAVVLAQFLLVVLCAIEPPDIVLDEFMVLVCAETGAAIRRAAAATIKNMRDIHSSGRCALPGTNGRPAREFPQERALS